MNIRMWGVLLLTEEEKAIHRGIYIAWKNMFETRRDNLIQRLHERPDDQILQGQIIELNQGIAAVEKAIYDVDFR